MSGNKAIKENLSKRLNETLMSFNSIKRRHEIFDRLFNELEAFDFETYKKNIGTEIQENLKNWWTNTEEGIIPSEELFAILFEYDYFLQSGVEAASYGIGEWKNYQVETDEFDMGSSYDFTTEFYACPGITLNFFDPLEILDHNSLEDKYKDVEIDEVEGYLQLLELYRLKGMIAIHETLELLDKQGSFDTLNCKENFMFIIDEHDSGEVYPLLIKNEKKDFTAATIQAVKTDKKGKKWWDVLHRQHLKLLLLFLMLN